MSKSEPSSNHQSTSRRKRRGDKDDGLFPEQTVEDPDATPLLEDPAAGRGLSRGKKQNQDFLGRIKQADAELSSKPVIRRRKKKVSNQPNEGVAANNWDEDAPEADSIPGNESGKQSNVILSVAVGAMALVAVVIAVIGYSGLRDVGMNDQNADAFAADGGAERPIDYEKASSAIKQFLDAQSVEELMGTVRHRERVEPLIEEYYARNSFEPVAYRAIPDVVGLPTDGRFMELNIVIDDKEERPIVLECRDEACKVDWECWVAYSEMDWEEFVEKRPTEPKLFRVMLGPYDYYNHRFGDSLDYRCFQIRNQDEYHILYGYVRRDSKVAGVLEHAFRKAPFGCMMVKMCYPEDNPSDTLGNQVIITEFVRTGWVDRS